MTTQMEVVEICALAMAPKLGSRFMLQQTLVDTALRVSMFLMILQTATGIAKKIDKLFVLGIGLWAVFTAAAALNRSKKSTGSLTTPLTTSSAIALNFRSDLCYGKSGIQEREKSPW